MLGRSGTCLNGMRFSLIFVWTFAIAMLLRSATSTMEVLGPQSTSAETRQILLPELIPSDKPWSKEWMEDKLPFGEEGQCNPVRMIYQWRNVGWGSNINQMLAKWVKRSIFQGTNNFAIDVSPPFLRSVNCSSVAHEAENGWDCLFKPMTRLCTFDNEAEIQEFVDRGGVLDENEVIQIQPPNGARRDSVETAAALLKFINSHAQPWFSKDIQAVISTGDVATLRSKRYIALHVRRGDKVRLREAGKIEVHVYLQAAALNLWQSSGNHDGVDSIAGIFLASDDSGVLAEVQQLAPSYFPNVVAERVTTISFRTTKTGVNNVGDEFPTTSSRMTYELYVGLHAELRMMSEGDVFVGTFSSNIGRLVYLMRETNGLLRNSTVSVDQRDWYLN